MAQNPNSNERFDRESFRERYREQFGRGSSGPDAFFRWAEGAGIPVEEIKRQMRETFRDGFRPNSPEWRRFIRQFFDGEATPGMPGSPNGDTRRANVLSLRVDDATLAAIDSLVEAGMFGTRAESAAWLLQAGVSSNTELFTRINATVAEIRRLREELQQRMNNAHATNTPPQPAAPADDAPVTPL